MLCNKYLWGKLNITQIMEYYYRNSTGTSCNPTSPHQQKLETNLLGGTDSITSEMGYELCVANDATNYKVFAKENGGK